MPRKSKRVQPGKRYPLNMRTTKELRDKVEDAALLSGRSLVQEVEFRLEQSFERDIADKERAAWMAALLSTLLGVTDRSLPADEAVKQLMAQVTGAPQRKDGVS